jgi:hypothetical protein
MCECCGGDCKLHGEEMIPEPIRDVSKIMVERLISLGRAQRLLKEIMSEEIFDGLSKHNVYWTSQHDKEDEKLDDTRRKLVVIYDNLCDLHAVLHDDV